MVDRGMDPRTTPARHWLAYSVEREIAEQEQQQGQATQGQSQDIEVLSGEDGGDYL